MALAVDENDFLTEPTPVNGSIFRWLPKPELQSSN